MSASDFCQMNDSDIFFVFKTNLEAQYTNICIIFLLILNYFSKSFLCLVLFKMIDNTDQWQF